MKRYDAWKAARVGQRRSDDHHDDSPRERHDGLGGLAITFTVPAGVASGNVFVWKNANSGTGVVDNLSLVAT